MPKSYLQFKQQLIIERNAIEGIKTSFSWITCDSLKGSFAKEGILEFESDKIPNASEVSTDTTHYILQKNETSTNTRSFSTLAPTQLKEIDLINTKLRLLDMIRSVDNELKKREIDYPEHQDFYREQRKNLADNCTRLMLQSDIVAIPELESYHQQELIKIIHASGLDRGLKTKEDYTQLLERYRNEEAELDPATVLESRYTYAKNITYQQISVPVTEKTPEQLAALQETETLATSSSDNKNSHNAAPKSFQELNIASSARKAFPNRRQAAQMRKENYYGGAYNATVDRLVIQEKDKPPATGFITGGSGSPAYVGKNETTERVQAAAQENIKQLQNTTDMLMGENTEIGIVQLVSKTIWNGNKEKTIATQTKQACAAKNIQYNLVPVNAMGAVLSNDIADENKNEIPWVSRIKTIFSKIARYELAATIKSTIKKIIFYTCASGQDRTNTAKTKAQLNFAKEQGFDKADTEAAFAKMSHAAHLASNASEGSLGLKDDSEAASWFSWFKGLTDWAGDLFNTALTKTLYRGSAHTNKLKTLQSLPVMDKSINPEIADDVLQKGDRLIKVEKKEKIAEISSISDTATLLNYYATLFDSTCSADPNYFPIINALCDKLVVLLQKSENQEKDVQDVSEDPRVTSLIQEADTQKKSTLLTAYSLGNAQVDTKIVQEALKEKISKKNHSPL